MGARPTGWVGGDPFSEDDGAGALDGIGGYIRFTNGIECFSHVRTVVRIRAGESGQGLEVIGTHGLLYNGDTGLHLAKAQDGYEPGQLAHLTVVEELFADTRNTRPRGYDEEGWMTPTPGMIAAVQALVEALESGNHPRMSTGDDLRKSHRQGFAPIKLPVEDRSLLMHPIWRSFTATYAQEHFRTTLPPEVRIHVYRRTSGVITVHLVYYAVSPWEPDENPPPRPLATAALEINLGGFHPKSVYALDARNGRTDVRTERDGDWLKVRTDDLSYHRMIVLE